MEEINMNNKSDLYTMCANHWNIDRSEAKTRILTEFFVRDGVIVDEVQPVDATNAVLLSLPEDLRNGILQKFGK